jgi:hypothetical protein
MVPVHGKKWMAPCAAQISWFPPKSQPFGSVETSEQEFEALIPIEAERRQMVSQRKQDGFGCTHSFSPKPAIRSFEQDISKIGWRAPIRLASVV